MVLEEYKGWQRRSSGKFTICYLVFLRKRRRWAFLNTLQALDPPTFKSFGLTLPTKRLWASLICSKTARYRLFLAVVRCCVTTTLAAETFSLLSVYLNYKFGLGLPSFYLFFSLFKKMLNLHQELLSKLVTAGVCGHPWLVYYDCVICRTKKTQCRAKLGRIQK